MARHIAANGSQKQLATFAVQCLYGCLAYSYTWSSKLYSYSPLSPLYQSFIVLIILSIKHLSRIKRLFIYRNINTVKDNNKS